MIFLKNVILFFIILFLNTGYSSSNESIAYIDIDFIIKNSEVGKKTLTSLNNINKKNIDILKQKEKILKEIETQIANKKNIISEENFDKEVKLFREKVDKFKKEQVQMVKEFNDYKKKELDNIFNKINPVINSYMEKKSVKILLDSKNILIGRNDLNYTNEVLDEINKKIK